MSGQGARAAIPSPGRFQALWSRLTQWGLLPALALLLLLKGGCTPRGLRRFSDRPVLWQDDDRRHLSTSPAPWRRGRWATVLASQVTEPLERLLSVRRPGPALNINAMGEVPSSSWFENRNHLRARSLSLVRRGGASTDGPSLLAPWTVLWAARTRRGPVVAIADELKRRYLLTFDGPGHPRLATTAELVSTLLLHCIGYRVPERHMVLFDRRQLHLAPSSQLRDGGRKARLDRKELTKLLGSLPRLSDGSLRAVATLDEGWLNLGPWRFGGRRSDDPNDHLNHERRRELRGLAVVAAWLNISTISSGVGQDRFRAQRPRYVVHRLERLRGALGSTEAGRPKALSDGFRSILSPPLMLYRALTFGAVNPPWLRLRSSRASQLRRWPGLGWLPSDSSSPGRFRPRLDNAAFAAADHRDRFWAARLLASVTAEQLRAIISEALLPKAEARRLLRVLLSRRLALLRKHLALRPPFQGYRLLGRSSRLCFVDLWRREGFDGERLVTYQLRLRSDAGVVPGSTRSHRSRSAVLCVALPSITPAGSDDGYRVLELRRPDLNRGWAKVHLRLTSSGRRVAGVER